jgi:hypothetical protein
MKNYTLTNGKQIHVFETEMEGMAGETMIVIWIHDENKNVLHHSCIKHLLTLKDRCELENWLNYRAQWNYESAVNHCL